MHVACESIAKGARIVVQNSAEFTTTQHWNLEYRERVRRIESRAFFMLLTLHG